MRTTRIILGTILAAAALILIGSSTDTREAYHKWRLREAIENVRTAGEGKPTAAQEFIALLRGEPRTTADYEEAWRYHEEALVKLNVLTRREFILPRPVASDDCGRIISAAEREFGADGLWSVTSPRRDSDAVVVTALPAEIARWEDLMRQFCDEPRGVRRYSFFRPRRTAGW